MQKMSIMERVSDKARAVAAWKDTAKHVVLNRVIDDERGQGTTEYAILVGVLVIIALVAVVAFGDKIEELWKNILTSFDNNDLPHLGGNGGGNAGGGEK